MKVAGVLAGRGNTGVARPANCELIVKKRGSPLTKMFASRVIWLQGPFDFSCYKII